MKKQTADSMRTITWDDGYTVTVDDSDLLTITKGGKTQKCHATRFNGPVPERSRAWTAIKKAGNNPADYLYANVFGGIILRAGNGVRELVAEIIARHNVERTEADKAAAEKYAADCAKACKDSGLLNPVVIRVEYCDGYPMYVHYNGHKIEMRWLTWKTVGNIAVAEKGELDSAITAGNRRSEQAEAEKADRAKARAEKIEAAKIEARETGKPVMIESWVTDRCHNGNDDECSFDNARQYAMPDGTITVKYTCCF